MPLKAFYMSINATFRLTHEKREMFQWTVCYMLKIVVRDTIKSLLKQL